MLKSYYMKNNKNLNKINNNKVYLQKKIKIKATLTIFYHKFQNKMTLNHLKNLKDQ